MKSSMWLIHSVVLIASAAWFGRPAPAFAQEGNGGVPADRLARLERQVNQMAERQEQLMRRLGAQQERPEAKLQPGSEGMRPQFPPVVAPPWAMQNPRAANMARNIHDALGLLFVVGIVCNILLSIWIFTDIRKRGDGSGIFVALALVAGIPAAIIYSLTRIADKKA